ncbi:MAG: hypothetical protein Fur005_34030 [Roseiflexaceae bacterium]
MTFNLLGSNLHYEHMVAAIQAAKPDLVALQELTPLSAQALTEQLGASYPYRTLEPFDQATGVGLISRFPIRSAEAFDLPSMDLAVHVVVEVQQQPVHVLVVHLTPTLLGADPARYEQAIQQSYARRAAEVERLMTLIDQLDGPLILMCDCNMTDTTPSHSRLSERLVDSFRAAGSGFGHTLRLGGSDIPLRRVDYIWHSDAFQSLSAEVGVDGSSDHLPLIADLILLP